MPPKPHLRALLACLAFLLHLSLANALLSLLLPVSLLAPTRVYNASSRIASSVWTHIQRLFTRTNGARILVTGDALPPGESAILVSNHVEWTDFYLIQELALRAGMLGRCRWFAKKELKWVPFLGWGLWAMGMPLVSRRWMEDKRELDRVFEGVVEGGWPIWLISFSESTRLTPKKRLAAAAFAAKTGKTLPQHLLLPRTKGFATSVRHLRAAPHVKAVYDLTVAYADMGERNERRKRGETDAQIDTSEAKTNGVHKGALDAKHRSSFAFQSPPAFAQSVLLPNLARRWKTLVHVRRFPLEELPESEVGLKLWLEERWVEKGEVLEGLRQKLERGESWDGEAKKAM